MIDKDKLIESVDSLYSEIDKCISSLIHARINHDAEKEGVCLFLMESLMVNTQQELCCISNYLNKNQKNIIWMY